MIDDFENTEAFYLSFSRSAPNETTNINVNFDDPDGVTLSTVEEKLTEFLTAVYGYYVNVNLTTRVGD